MARHAGLDVPALVRKHGLDPACIYRPYYAVPLDAYLALLEDAAVLADRPFLGMDAADVFYPLDVGVEGQLLAARSTIWRCLRQMQLHVAMEQDLTVCELSDDGERVVFSYLITDGSLWPRRHDAEGIIYDMCCAIRGDYMADWNPIEIHFEHGLPETTIREQYAARFGCPVLFNQTSNRIICASAEAHRQIREEDPELIQLLERQMREEVLHPEAGSDLVWLVSEIIDRELGRQQITLDLVAGDLAMSTRSLQRRLKEEGTSLRQLVQERRMALAELALCDGRRSITEIAEMLGYADSTAFWRAYREWTGRAPTVAAGRRAGQGREKEPATRAC